MPINKGISSHIHMPSTTAEQLSIYDIAKRTGYTAAAIHNALERHNKKPDIVTPGGVRYFSEHVVPFLLSVMRKPAPQKK